MSLRLGLRALAGVLALALGLSLAAPAGAAEPVPDNGGARAAVGTFEDLASCVSSSNRLLVLLAIGEARSLRTTDPRNQRIPAAKAAVASLAGLTSEAGPGGTQVDVLVARFSGGLAPVGDWTRLDASSVGTVQKRIDGLADRNDGLDTDYPNMLLDTQRAFADKSAEITANGAPSPCKVIILFTDGKYLVAPRTTQAEVEQFGDRKPYAPGITLDTAFNAKRAMLAGVHSLCDAGGVADQLRRDGVVTAMVALTTNISQINQDNIEAIALGKSPGWQCGAVDGSRSGAFLPAGGIDALIASFDQVANGIGGGQLVTSDAGVRVCPGDPCAEGSRTLTLDASLRKAHVLVTLPSTTSGVELTGPDGKDTTRITDRSADTATIAGATASVRWLSDRAVTIDLDLPPDNPSWIGDWTVTVFDPASDAPADATATVQAFVFTDIVPKLDQHPKVEIGQSATFQVSLATRSGDAPASSQEFSAASVTGDVFDPVTESHDTITFAGDPQSGFTGTYDVPADLTTSVLRLTLRLEATTADGVQLRSGSDVQTLPVSRPPAYPVLAPPELQLSSVTRQSPATGTLQVRAREAAACVWFDPVKVTSRPEGVGSFTTDLSGAGTSRSECVEVAKGQQAQVSLEVTPSSKGSGLVKGVVRAHLQAGDGDVLDEDIPVQFEMARGVDQAKRLALAVLLMVGGVALPLGALVLVNKVGARFQDLSAVRGSSVPVVVRRNGQILRRDPDTGRLAEASLYGADFVSLADRGSTRRFTFAGLDIQARAGWNPFSEAHALIAPEGGAVKLKGSEGRRVELDLGLAGSWLFLYDQDATRAATARLSADADPAATPPEIHGQLVAFVAEGPVPPQVRRLMADVHDRLQATASRLARLANR